MRAYLVAGFFMIACLKTATAAPSDLAGVWVPNFGETGKPPPDGSPGPVQPVGPWMGDHTSPILRPEAAKKVKKVRDLHAAGDKYMAPEQQCLPYGVPRIINIPYPTQILLTKNFVLFLYESASWARFVYLNEKLPENPKPRWMGHSVGRWEGDTLVVETIGHDARTDVDPFGTPHTESMHVTEYYTVAQDGKTLNVRYMVDDPKTFTTKWSTVSRFSRTDAPLMEYVCAENNRDFQSATQALQR